MPIRIKGAPSRRIERKAMAKLENASECTRGRNQKEVEMTKAISKQKIIRVKKGVPSETNLRARVDCLRVEEKSTKIFPHVFVSR